MRTRSWLASQRAPRQKCRNEAPAIYAPKGLKENRLRSKLSGSLAGALPIAFGLVGIDFAHALEQFLSIGLFDLRSAGSITAAAGTGSHWPIFLSLVRHNFDWVNSRPKISLKQIRRKIQSDKGVCMKFFEVKNSSNSVRSSVVISSGKVSSDASNFFAQLSLTPWL